MKYSVAAKLAVVGFLGLTLLGATSPKTAQQIDYEKKALRRELSVLRRCGYAQIRSGKIPKRIFEQCAEVYQQFGMTLFPNHKGDSSTGDETEGDSLENTAVSYPTPFSSSYSSISSVSTSLSSLSSSSQKSTASSSMITGSSASLASSGSSSSVSSVAPTPFPARTFASVPSPEPSIVYAQPTIGLSPDDGGGIQPIS